MQKLALRARAMARIAMQQSFFSIDKADAIRYEASGCYGTQPDCRF
jgi:hypothetical protein